MTQRHQPRFGDRDEGLRERLRQLSVEHPRWGYRMVWGVVRDEGWAVNRKKIQRLWREEGLRVPQRKRKRYRLGESTVPGERLRAERPNHVWALDFQFDTTSDGRTLKLLHVVDEYTREALAIRVARSSMPTTPSACSTGSSASAAEGRSCCAWITARS